LHADVPAPCPHPSGLAEFKKPFAHQLPYQPDLHAAIKAFQSDAIVGVSSQQGEWCTSAAWQEFHKLCKL
jgi:hypothetical protein